MKKLLILFAVLGLVFLFSWLISWLALGCWWKTGAPCSLLPEPLSGQSIEPPWVLPFGVSVYENDGAVCFTPVQGEIRTQELVVKILEPGCGTRGCTQVFERTGSMQVNASAYSIQLTSRFAFRYFESKNPICGSVINLCGGAGYLEFQTGALPEGAYKVWLGQNLLGEIILPLARGGECLEGPQKLFPTVTPVFNSEYPPPGLAYPTGTPAAYPMPIQPSPTAQPDPIPTLPYAPSVSIPVLVTNTFPAAEEITSNAVYFLDNENQLWAANLDGSGEKRLWYGAEQAALSPDGQWLSAIQGTAVWLVPAAGGEAVKLFEADRSQGKSLSEPTWSPDSHSLLFVQSDVMDMPTPHIVWLVKMGTGEARKLAQFDTGYPVQLAWSPDGKKIAYTRTHELVLLEVAGGQQTILTNGECNYLFGALSWSPAGDWIAHRHYTSGPFSKNINCLSSVFGENFGLELDRLMSSLAWETTGSAFYYLAQDVIWSVPERQVKGAMLIRYALKNHQTEELLSWQAENRSLLWDLRLSPDGSRLAYAISTWPGQRLRLVNLPDLSIEEYDLAGLSAGRSFAWSSDGSQIIFTDELSKRLFAFDLRGEEIRQISGEHAVQRWWTGAGAALP